MKIAWNKVTWYSKLFALVIFVALPFLGFWLGLKYAELRGPLSFVAVRSSDEPATTAPPATPPAGQSQVPSADSKTDLLARNIVTISGEKSFELPGQPQVTFVIHGIRKASGGVAAEKCGSGDHFIFLRTSQLFAAQGSCVNAGENIDGAPTALAIVDLEIKNESNAYIDSRFLQLFYNSTGSNGEETRIAKANPPLEGYGALPRGTRRVLVGFEIPEALGSAQLTYGDYGRARAVPLSNEEFFSRSVGGFIVDFEKKTLDDIPG